MIWKRRQNQQHQDRYATQDRIDDFDPCVNIRQQLTHFIFQESVPVPLHWSAGMPVFRMDCRYATSCSNRASAFFLVRTRSTPETPSYILRIGLIWIKFADGGYYRVHTATAAQKFQCIQRRPDMCTLDLILKRDQDLLDRLAGSG